LFWWWWCSWYSKEAILRDAAAQKLQREPTGSFLIIRMLEGSRILPELCLLRKAHGGEAVEDVLIIKRDHQYVLSFDGQEYRTNTLSQLVRLCIPLMELRKSDDAVCYVCCCCCFGVVSQLDCAVRTTQNS
jgi:hypothetical protein